MSSKCVEGYLLRLQLIYWRWFVLLQFLKLSIYELNEKSVNFVHLVWVRSGQIQGGGSVSVCADLRFRDLFYVALVSGDGFSIASTSYQPICDSTDFLLSWLAWGQASCHRDISHHQVYLCVVPWTKVCPRDNCGLAQLLVMGDISMTGMPGLMPNQERRKISWITYWLIRCGGNWKTHLPLTSAHRRGPWISVCTYWNWAPTLICPTLTQTRWTKIDWLLISVS